MSARLYPNAFGQLAAGTLDWTALNIKGLLLSEGFTYDGTLQFRDQLDESFVIATSEAIPTPTFDDSVAGGTPVEWLQLLDNRDAYHIVLFDDTGDDAYSELIMYLQAEDVDGLQSSLLGANYYLYPVTPPGGFFSLGLGAAVLGPVNTYHLAYTLALGESIGGQYYTIPTLVFGLDVVANERVCYRAPALDEEECGPPTIRSSLCE